MANVEFGINTPSIRKMRLYYYGTKTIYEGMPLCYDYAGTTNVLGYSKSEGGEDARQQTTRTTTAEGYQNEGKFMRVSDPAAASLMWFAGVVAAGGYVGSAGPKWVDVYEPNGAIVPVRSGVSSTVGVSVLAIKASTQYFCLPTDASRSVALAEETVAGATGTPLLCLAKLAPNMFISVGNSTSLLAFAGTAAVVANQINLTTAQTAARFTAFQVSAASTAGAGSDGWGLAAYFEADISAATASHCAGVGIWMNLTGGTQSYMLTPLEVGLYESGANLAACDIVAPITIRQDIDATNPPASTCNYMMYFRAENGVNNHTPDGLFCAYTSETIKMTPKSSAAVSHIIPIKIKSTGAGPGAGTYYLMVSNVA